MAEFTDYGMTGKPPGDSDVDHLFSVVVLATHGEQFNPDLFGSIIDRATEQDLGFEIVFVDITGRTEMTERILRQYRNIRIIVPSGTLSFAGAVNLAVRESRGDLVVILPCDAELTSFGGAKIQLDFDSEEDLFAIGMAMQTETGETLHPPRTARFERGEMIEVPAGDDLTRPAFCLSYGIGVYDRRKFLTLGGLDGLYSSRDWAFRDLVYRAWKTGWVTIYDSTVRGKVRSRPPRGRFRDFLNRNRYLVYNVHLPGFLSDLWVKMARVFGRGLLSFRFLDVFAVLRFVLGVLPALAERRRRRTDLALDDASVLSVLDRQRHER